MENQRDSALFQAEVERELYALQTQPLQRLGPAPYANPLRRIEALSRREWERLARLERWERVEHHERTRERVAHERNRPWREQDRWGLRKRVWRERRDRERSLIDRREQELLAREQELLEQHRRWLGELAELAPEQQEWCAAEARRAEAGELEPADLEELAWRRRQAATRYASELLARPELRAALGPALSASPQNATRAAQIVTPLLLEQALPIPRIPALFAALALQIADLP